MINKVKLLQAIKFELLKIEITPLFIHSNIIGNIMLLNNLLNLFCFNYL